MEAIAERIRMAGNANKIVVLAGAGISVAAGIPDFRSTKGVYAQLAECHELPTPEALFSHDYFLSNPKPLFRRLSTMMSGVYSPTPVHAFFTLLQQKGFLSRVYTQNIDGLEREAGVSPDLLVECHGTFASSSCQTCARKYDLEYFRSQLLDHKVDVVRCHAPILPSLPPTETSTSQTTFGKKENQNTTITVGTAAATAVSHSDPISVVCGGVVKPDIVLFGEALPERFLQCMMKSTDFKDCTMLLVLGTSLVVHPFAQLISMVSDTTPRCLFNDQLVGSQVGFMYGQTCNERDVFIDGDCQAVIRQFVESLGWSTEFEAIIEACGARISGLPPAVPVNCVL
jgi:NAD-dependent SIR2 family protein deacetylase